MAAIRGAYDILRYRLIPRGIKVEMKLDRALAFGHLRVGLPNIKQ